MFKSVISTPKIRYAVGDAKDFYLGTPLDDFEYTRMPTKPIPSEFVALYGLHDKLRMTMSTSKYGKECRA